MFRDKIDVKNIYGCHASDIPGALARHRPDILQFLGHGNKDGLYFEDENDKADLVSMEAFAGLLGQCKTLKLVILNTCYSRSQGQCIADAVGCLIGMEGKIRNKDAINFTKSFYEALGNGFTVEGCFHQAGSVIKLDPEARFQAHLLRKERISTSISTPQLASSAWSDYRGLSMNTTHWPFVLAISLSVLATGVTFTTFTTRLGRWLTCGRGPGMPRVYERLLCWVFFPYDILFK